MEQDTRVLTARQRYTTTQVDYAGSSETINVVRGSAIKKNSLMQLILSFLKKHTGRFSCGWVFGRKKLH